MSKMSYFSSSKIRKISFTNLDFFINFNQLIFFFFCKLFGLYYPFLLLYFYMLINFLKYKIIFASFLLRQRRFFSSLKKKEKKRKTNFQLGLWDGGSTLLFFV